MTNCAFAHLGDIPGELVNAYSDFSRPTFCIGGWFVDRVSADTDDRQRDDAGTRGAGFPRDTTGCHADTAAQSCQ